MNIFYSILDFLKEMVFISRLEQIELLVHSLSSFLIQLLENRSHGFLWNTVITTKWNINFENAYSYSIGLTVSNSFSTKYFFVISLCLLLTCVIVLVLKNLRRDFRVVDSVFLLECHEEEESRDIIIRNKIYMPKDKEYSILNSIVDCENNKFFLSKDLKLCDIAFDLGIEEVYLAYVIKKHRGKDFTTYVNDLRISYIVTRLTENPIYLEYKISYLACHSGFSSHSGFTITFKRVTGESPSVFISNLKNKRVET